MNNLNRRDLLRLMPAAALASTSGMIAQTANINAQDANTPLTEKVAYAQRPPKEVRGIWIHPERYFSADSAEGRKQVRSLVQRFARANFNLLLPWTTSGYLAALDSTTYQKTHPTATWDALGVLIEEAAREGIDVDLWYSFTDYRQPNSPEFDPSVGGNPQWSARRLDEVVHDAKTGKLAEPRHDNVCPQYAGARTWQKALLVKTLRRYAKVHGLHIEEPGYRQRGYCLCDLCRKVYGELHSKDLTVDLDSSEAEDFRTIGTSAFMSEMRDEMQKNFPRVVYSANGGPDWRHDRKRGRDWGRWALSGWLQYYAPQVYEPRLSDFREQLQLTVNDIGKACSIYAGIALDWSTGKNTVPGVIEDIEAARSLGCPGLLFFHGAVFTDQVCDALRAGPFKRPA